MPEKMRWHAGDDHPQHRPDHRNGYRSRRPSAKTFARGCAFASWLGLAPRQAFAHGKQKLGAISKMGERALRRLLIIGSRAVVL